MKKLLPFAIILLAALGIGYNLINKDSGNQTNTSVANNTSNSSNGSASSNEGGQNPSEQDISLEGAEGTDERTEDIKPAAVAYSNAADALAAIKKGAVDYDDLILEQFTNPGEDCTFCTELYSQIKDLLADAAGKNEEKAFFAEILAISGRTENVKTLVEGFKQSAATDQKEIFASALELVSGKDDVVKYLGTELATSDNADLKESVVAALTNQGSTLAFDTLYQHIVDTKNAEGYSSMGIGVSEMMLSEEALPAAQQKAQKRDEYAPLVVKAMLNSGLPGLRMVMDLLSTSTNIEADRRLIKDAVEHVGYDEQIEKYLQEIEKSSSPLAKEFAQQILQDYAQQEEAIEQEPIVDEAPMTMAN
jgi:hypothetical protein